MANLSGRIGNLLDNWVEWQHCPPPPDLPETSMDSCPHIATWAELMFHGDERVAERVQTVSFHLRQQKPPILYRPRAELELATALLGVVDNVVQTVDKLRHAATYRHQMWSARTLRSRARVTCQRMWAVLPELWTGLLCILMITTRCYQSLPLLAQHAQFAHRLKLPKNKDIHGRQTRHADDFILQPHRTALFEKKPSYTGAKLFNVLPDELKTQDSATMRRQLREWLINKSIYTMDEFMTHAGGTPQH
ncbi:hypothetical protein J6590_025406 [Homalodisca vitripennis]|nr:hypothetical protein J6590_025406 [Homalodisca vitripennis]